MTSPSLINTASLTANIGFIEVTILTKKSEFSKLLKK